MNPTSWDRLRDILLSPASLQKKWAFLVLALLVLALLGPALFSDRLLLSDPAGDLTGQFLGWRAFGFNELKKGHLALWNPYVYCGAPYFAGFQSALLYPPNWIFLILPLHPALNLSIALHVLLMGLFSYLWFSHRPVPFAAALVGAVAMMWGGAFYPHLSAGHLPNLCAMPWVPLVFLALDRLKARPDMATVLWGTAVLSMELLAGHPQYFLYTLLFASLYALILFFRDIPQGVPLLAGAALTALGAAGITATQWLPGLEAAEDFGRAGLKDPASLQWFSLHPMAFWTLLCPISGQGPALAQFTAASRTWWESCLFLGPGVLFLAVRALPRNVAERQGNGWVLGLALAGLLFALGPWTPFYGLLRALPYLDSFRGPAKAVFFFQLFTALLAVLGAQRFLSPPPGKARISRSAILLAVMAFLGAWLPWSLPAFPAGPDLRWAWAAAFLFSSLHFFLYGLGNRRSDPDVRVLLVLTAILPLLFFALRNTPSFDLPRWIQGTVNLPEGAREKLGDGRIYWNGPNDRSMLLGMPSIWGDDPFPSLRYQALMEAPRDKGQPPDVDQLRLDPLRMALTRVSLFLSQGPDGLSARPNPAPRLARFNLIGKAQVARDMADARRILETPGFDPGRVVVLETQPDPPPVENGGKGRIDLRIHSTERFEFTIRSEEPQVLLMTDTYAKGWKALAYPESAQKAYQVLPADIFCRAIPLAAGSHHFELLYDAPGLALGRALSKVSLFLYLVLGGGWAWRRYGRKGTP